MLKARDYIIPRDSKGEGGDEDIIISTEYRKESRLHEDDN